MSARVFTPCMHALHVLLQARRSEKQRLESWRAAKQAEAEAAAQRQQEAEQQAASAALQVRSVTRYT